MKLALTIGSLMLWASLNAQSQAPKIFASPDAAAQALIQAAGQNNTAQLTTIFGAQGHRTLSSGNTVQDEAECRHFAQMAQTQHRLETDPTNPSRMFLVVGADEWPFPAPIVKTAGGWMFDASPAAVEMKARRIGANELDAIEVSEGFVTAQREYATQARDQHKIREYAQQIMSSPGQHNGLYWTGDSAPFVPRGLAEADFSSSNPKPYHGYYFRVLKSQGTDAVGGQHQYVVKDMMFGGFALVAWPAEYGVTGVHTFIVNQRGQVYEKDLGRQTRTLAPAMRTYNPDNSWNDVE